MTPPYHPMRHHVISQHHHITHPPCSQKGSHLAANKDRDRRKGLQHLARHSELLGGERCTPPMYSLESHRRGATWSTHTMLCYAMLCKSIERNMKGCDGWCKPPNLSGCLLVSGSSCRALPRKQPVEVGHEPRAPCAANFQLWLPLSCGMDQ